MNIHPPDEDLLLLAHRALPWGRALPARIHLLACARCRARLHRFANVSRLMAGAVRGPELPPWPGPMPAPALPTAAGWLLLLVVTLTLTTLIVLGAAHLGHRPTVSSPLRATGGCRPGLPSDQCR